MKTTLLTPYGQTGIADRFQDGSVLKSDTAFQIFPDGELGTCLMAGDITDQRILVLGTPDSARAILQVVDLAFGAWRYEPALLAFGFSGQPHTEDDPTYGLLDRTIGYLVSSVPQVPHCGNMFVSFDGQDELYITTRLPEPDSDFARQSRRTLREELKTALGLSGISHIRFDPLPGRNWLGAPASRSAAPQGFVYEHDPNLTGEPVLVSIRSYDYLRRNIAALGGYEDVAVEYCESIYGISLPKAPRTVRGREVLVVAGTPTDQDFLELALLLVSLKEAGASKIVCAIPYFGCARMDREANEGEIVTVKTRAAMLSALPKPPRGTRFVLFDLHSDVALGAFEGVQVQHQYMRPILDPATLAALDGTLNGIYSPDAGRAKWARSRAKKLGIDVVIVDKDRISGSQTTDFRIVSGEHLIGGNGVMSDDLTNTAGSLVGAGGAVNCDRHPMDKLAAELSHGPTTEEAVPKLMRCGKFSAMVVTNSHPNAVRDYERYPDFVRLVDMAPLIKAVHAAGPRRVVAL